MKKVEIPTASAEASNAALCAVCQQPIRDNRGFCQLTASVEKLAQHRGQKIYLCTPACALHYFKTLEETEKRV